MNEKQLDHCPVSPNVSFIWEEHAEVSQEHIEIQNLQILLKRISQKAEISLITPWVGGMAMGSS